MHGVASDFESLASLWLKCFVSNLQLGIREFTLPCIEPFAGELPWASGIKGNELNVMLVCMHALKGQMCARSLSLLRRAGRAKPRNARPYRCSATPSVCILPMCRLAALEACSGCPLSRLTLTGAVPLSAATAEAVAACCPNLSDLHLTDVLLCLPPEGPRRAEAAAEYHYGYSLLLTLCGSRLRELHLSGMEAEPWPALSFMALRQCTALTKLVMEAPNLTSSPDVDGEHTMLSPGQQLHCTPMYVHHWGLGSCAPAF